MVNLWKIIIIIINMWFASVFYDLRVAHITVAIYEKCQYLCGLSRDILSNIDDSLHTFWAGWERSNLVRSFRVIHSFSDSDT